MSTCTCRTKQQVPNPNVLQLHLSICHRYNIKNVHVHVIMCTVIIWQAS